MSDDLLLTDDTPRAMWAVEDMRRQERESYHDTTLAPVGSAMRCVLVGHMFSHRQALCAPRAHLRATCQHIVSKERGSQAPGGKLWPVPYRWDCTNGVLAASRRSEAKGLDRWGRLATAKRPRGTVSVSQYTSRSLCRGGRTPSSQDKPTRRATTHKWSGSDTLNGTEQVNRAILNTWMSLFSSSSAFLSPSHGKDGKHETE